MLSKRVAKERKNESGSLFLEVMTILALIGVLGPLIYSQVARRIEESRNVTLAGEMRAVKEAFEQLMVTDYDSIVNEKEGYNTNNVCNYLAGYCTGKTDDSGKFVGWEKSYGTDNFVLRILPGYQSVADVNGYERRLFQGVIIPRREFLPNNLSVRRAARIASLIGIDGGIWADLNKDAAGNRVATGVLGSWSLSMSALTDALKSAELYNNPQQNAYLAVTKPDLLSVFQEQSETFKTEKTAAQIGETYAVDRLNAWRHFSVADSNVCVTAQSRSGTKNALVRDDIIATPQLGDVSGSCHPLFWVGTLGTKDKDGNWVPDSAGHVFVKNSLLLAPVSSNVAAVELVNNAGNGELSVRSFPTDAKDASEATENLTIANGKVSEPLNGKYFDPAFTSEIDDISLVSRGGVLLSQILPNRVLMGVYPVSCTTSSSSCSASVTKPTCESKYAPAIIVTPTKFDQLTDGTNNLSFVAKVDSANWKVIFGYQSSGGVWATPSPTVKWTAYGQAQTFCVYTP